MDKEIEHFIDLGSLSIMLPADMSSEEKYARAQKVLAEAIDDGDINIVGVDVL